LEEGFVISSEIARWDFGICVVAMVAQVGQDVVDYFDGKAFETRHDAVRLMYVIYVRSLLSTIPRDLLTLLRRCGCGVVDVGGRKREKPDQSKEKRAFMPCLNSMYRQGKKKKVMYGQKSHNAPCKV